MSPRNSGSFWCAATVMAACFLLLSPGLWAQSAGTGALTGTITDPTGGVVPNATVTLTKTDTNQVRTTNTGANGTYKFTLLPPGTYSVKFVATGFKSAEVPSVQVNVTETPVLDQPLQIGTQSEQVTVETTAELLERARSTLGTTVGSSTVTGHPLSNRN